MKNFIRNGETIEFTAKKALKSGDVVVIEELIAVVVNISLRQITHTICRLATR
ncbi:uncharacterized protein DUF2190 [Nicoletella semolina]|uniref:Uncharacterized protein DUF2190 n=1 Tax=Nicoletella semolina TaxID=271160 RepID=A0A4R2N9F2_9PAST|nr:hypothetical protein [Nicoletella semolina]TCP17632.1 uncharacterized protein DUF2190 [Nicoletella semolina]